MFPHRVESFFTKYLLSSAQPLGHITDYVIKIEFQMCGSPHAHCLLWVQDAPKIDRDPDEVVCAFIDKHITATLPTKTHENEHNIKLMENFQKHTHSDYCRRNQSCHFGFPKPPATQMLISRPSPQSEDDNKTLKNATKILKQVQHILSTSDLISQNMSILALLEKINVNIHTYMAALQVLQCGPNIILRRNVDDVFLNACNCDILALWGANIDLQFVANEVATVMYVCSYMTKGEKGMGETLRRVAKECCDDHIHTQMNKIKHEFLGKRVLGAPESGMHVLSTWLIKKSRKVVTVNTNIRDECVSLPKTCAQLEQLDKDDENMFATSLIDRYAARPNSLQNMCLATFAVNYDVVSALHTCDMEGMDTDEGTEEDMYAEGQIKNGECGMPERIKLKDGLGYMRKRKQESIL